ALRDPAAHHSAIERRWPQTDPEWSTFMVLRDVGIERCHFACDTWSLDGTWSEGFVARMLNEHALPALFRAGGEHLFPAWWASPPEVAAVPRDTLWVGCVQGCSGWPLPAFWCEWSAYS